MAQCLKNLLQELRAGTEDSAITRLHVFANALEDRVIDNASILAAGRAVMSDVDAAVAKEIGEAVKGMERNYPL